MCDNNYYRECHASRFSSIIKINSIQTCCVTAIVLYKIELSIFDYSGDYHNHFNSWLAMLLLVAFKCVLIKEWININNLIHHHLFLSGRPDSQLSLFGGALACSTPYWHMLQGNPMSKRHLKSHTFWSLLT